MPTPLVHIIQGGGVLWCWLCGLIWGVQKQRGKNEVRVIFCLFAGCTSDLSFFFYCLCCLSHFCFHLSPFDISTRPHTSHTFTRLTLLTSSHFCACISPSHFQTPLTLFHRALDSVTYYMVDTHQYVQLLNYSGCGNTGLLRCVVFVCLVGCNSGLLVVSFVWRRGFVGKSSLNPCVRCAAIALCVWLMLCLLNSEEIQQQTCGGRVLVCHGARMCRRGRAWGAATHSRVVVVLPHRSPTLCLSCLLVVVCGVLYTYLSTCSLCVSPTNKQPCRCSQ